LIKTEVTLNLTENNTYTIPITCNILVRSIHGRIRLFYSNNKPCWFGFVSKPVIKFNIDPVIGKNSKFELKNFPKLRNFLEELIEKSFDKFCLPNTKPLNIPITIIEQVDWPPKYMKKDSCI
jgi:Ca2+-dependent lipid-binding protein